MLEIGDKSVLVKTFTDHDVRAFSEASGDNNPVHLDDHFASQTQFNKRIVHGMLVAGLISAVLGTQLPGPGTIYLGQSLKFKAPVYIGDSITAVIEVINIRSGKPIITLSTNCYNQDKKLVIEGEAVVLAPE